MSLSQCMHHVGQGTIFLVLFLISVNFRDVASDDGQTCSGFYHGVASGDDGQTCSGFYHGVASGDPTHNSVIIWTRFTPTPTQAEVKISWAVFLRPWLPIPVKSGSVVTTEDDDFTVKVDVKGLKANTRYYYVFSRGNLASVLGTTKTLPSPGSERSKQLRFAVMSCANWGFGYFNVYDMVAKVKNLDFVLFLGDYTYEYGLDTFPSASQRVRPDLVPPSEITDLEDYRARNRQYKTDPMLQELHRRVPFIAVWDDHESANDAYVGGADNHQPNTEGLWADRVQAAIQAYQEYMPIRTAANGDLLEVYRSFSYGNIATIAVTEQRLKYRTPQYNFAVDPYIGYMLLKPFTEWVDAELKQLQAAYRQQLANPTSKIMGDTQLKLLESDFQQSKSSGIPWQVLGSQVIVGPQNAPDLESGLGALVQAGTLQAAEAQQILNVVLNTNVEGINGKVVVGLGRYKDSSNTDSWDGYTVEREALKTVLRDATNNAVVVSGDSHNNWAYEIRTTAAPQTPIALEFATASVTAPGFDFITGAFGPLADLINTITTIGLGVSNAPDLKFTELTRRGAVIMTLTRTSLRADYFSVDTVKQPSYSALCTATFTSTPGVKSLTRSDSCTTVSSLLMSSLYRRGDTLPWWSTLKKPGYNFRWFKLNKCKCRPKV